MSSCVTFHQWSELQAWNEEKIFPKLECQWVEGQQEVKMLKL